MSNPESSLPPAHLTGPGEHAVDAAMRGAHRGPPLPHRPSSWHRWGWRAALVVPLGVLALKAANLAAQPIGALDVALLTLATVTVLGGSARAWYLAGQPSLRFDGQRSVRGDLGRVGYRQVARALRRGEPLAEDLRPWAAAYAWSRRGELPYSSVFLAFLAGNALPTSPFSSDPGALDWLLVASLVLLLAGLIVTMGTSSWLWRNARRLDLPLDQLAPPAERS